MFFPFSIKVLHSQSVVLIQVLEQNYAIFRKTDRNVVQDVMWSKPESDKYLIFSHIQNIFLKIDSMKVENGVFRMSEGPSMGKWREQKS